MGLGLARALRLRSDESSRYPRGYRSIRAGGLTTAFAGAGGKTTALFQLAHELPSPVFVSATTHLGVWQASRADEHRIATSVAELSSWQPDGVSLVTGSAVSDERLEPVSNDALLWLHDTSRQRQIPLLIEADGARQRPLKAPAAHEPAIPAFADMVVVVAGLAAIGQPLDEAVVHRPDGFAALSGLHVGERITPEAVVNVLAHPQGGQKSIPPHARKVVLLNQADSPELLGQSRAMAIQLLAAYDAVLVASLQEGQVHAVHEQSAGIVLAAGASTRLGRSKQLLDWHGEPFVRVVARNALAAGLDPVVMVTGSDAEPVEAAVQGLLVRITRNGGWESGQAGSIRAGVQSLPPSVGSATFLLADQPQVAFDVITALVDTHAAGLFPIVAPLVRMERRANPVLFDRETFPDLLSLEGDVGGRAIFSKHHVEYMPWHDDRLLLDVDTEADYRRIVEDDTL